MFGSAPSRAHAYARVGVETGIASANPHQLVVMLYDGAIAALGTALQQMKAGAVAAKGQSISKAITIIDSGLRASLDAVGGGEIAANLDALYRYMSERLVTGNARNAPEQIDEVRQLLVELRQAWESIGARGDAGPPASAPRAEGSRVALEA